MITEDELDLTEAICKAAPEGPWRQVGADVGPRHAGSVHLKAFGPVRDFNAVLKFVEHAREYLPRLLEEVRNLRALKGRDYEAAINDSDGLASKSLLRRYLFICREENERLLLALKDLDGNVKGPNGDWAQRIIDNALHLPGATLRDKNDQTNAHNQR